MTAPTDENTPFPAEMSNAPGEPGRDGGPFRDRGETLQARKRALQQELVEIERELAPAPTPPAPPRRTLGLVAVLAALAGILTTAAFDHVSMRERTVVHEQWTAHVTPKPLAEGSPKHASACGVRFGPT